MHFGFGRELEALHACTCSPPETPLEEVEEAGRKTTSVFLLFEVTMACQQILDRTAIRGSKTGASSGWMANRNSARFSKNARSPMTGRVGAENDGWTVSNALLKYERGRGSNGDGLFAKPELVQASANKTAYPFGGNMPQDTGFPHGLEKLEADVGACRVCDYLVRRDQDATV